MTSFLKTAALTAALTVGATAASAATFTLDFTDQNSYVNFGALAASGSMGSANWTATPTPSEGPLTRTGFDGTDPGGTPLTFADYDGLGVVDDEISASDQRITLKFSTGLRVTGLHFLDLFGLETAEIYINGEALSSDSFVAQEPANQGTGYLFAKFTADVTSISFGASGIGNDLPNGGFGNPDFALAGIDFFSTDGNEPEPVPLPAAGLLLLTALGGLGVARRRKATRKAM